MGRLKREQSQARTRELLLEAGRLQVVTRGFAAASVRDIAEAAGFSQGAFYSNFDSKEELLLELLRRHKESELADINEMLDVTPDADNVLTAIDDWMHDMCAKQDWAVLAVELELHAARNPEFGAAYEALAVEHVRLVGKLIARIFHALGVTPPVPQDALATGFIALTHGLTLQRPQLTAAAWKSIFGAFVRGLVSGSQPR